MVRDVSDWLSLEDRLATGYGLRVERVHSRPEDELVGWLNYDHGVLGKLERSPQPLVPASGDEAPDSSAPRRDVAQNWTGYQIDLGRGVLSAEAVGRNERRVVHLVNTWVSLPVRTSDVGTGISQILPVVVAALDPDRPSMTAIEQPELHVHPRLQVELGDLFAQGVDQGGVFLMETHSEHLMLRLLRRIEETNSGELPEGKPVLKPDQVSVVYVEQIDGEVRATRLRIDETGEFIDRWPQGFFDERADELF